MKNTNDIFSSIAKNYDIMNTIISLGTHKIFKKKAVDSLNIKMNDIILDIAAGTGDITDIILNNYSSKIFSLDINMDMLKVGVRKNTRKLTINGNVEKLPFPNNSIDKVIIGFGIRNFSDLDHSLIEINRVLKKNGKLGILEFGQPSYCVIRLLRNIYFRLFIPIISKVLTNKYTEYQYLAESIIGFPMQALILQKIKKSGFTKSAYQNHLFGNIVIYNCIK